MLGWPGWVAVCVCANLQKKKHWFVAQVHSRPYVMSLWGMPHTFVYTLYCIPPFRIFGAFDTNYKIVRYLPPVGVSDLNWWPLMRKNFLLGVVRTTFQGTYFGRVLSSLPWCHEATNESDALSNLVHSRKVARLTKKKCPCTKMFQMKEVLFCSLGNCVRCHDNKCCTW